MIDGVRDWRRVSLEAGKLRVWQQQLKTADVWRGKSAIWVCNCISGRARWRSAEEWVWLIAAVGESRNLCGCQLLDPRAKVVELAESTEIEVSAFLAEVRCVNDDFARECLFEFKAPCLLVGCVKADARHRPNRCKPDIVQGAERASRGFGYAVRRRIAECAARSPVIHHTCTAGVGEVHCNPWRLDIETLEAPGTRSRCPVPWS